MASPQPESDETTETIGSVLEEAIVPDLEKMGTIIDKSANLTALASLILIGMQGLTAYKNELKYESQRKGLEAMTQQPGITDEIEGMITSQIQKLDTGQSATRVDECLDASCALVVVAIMLTMRSSVKRTVAKWKQGVKDLKRSVDTAQAAFLKTAREALVKRTEEALAKIPPREVNITIVMDDSDASEEVDASDTVN